MHPLDKAERKQWLRQQETVELVAFIDTEFSAVLKGVLGGLSGMTETQIRSRLVKLKTLQEIKHKIQNGNNGNGSADKPNPTGVSDAASS